MGPGPLGHASCIYLYVAVVPLYWFGIFLGHWTDHAARTGMCGLPVGSVCGPSSTNSRSRWSCVLGPGGREFPPASVMRGRSRTGRLIILAELLQVILVNYKLPPRVRLCMRCFMNNGGEPAPHVCLGTS